MEMLLATMPMQEQLLMDWFLNLTFLCNLRLK